MMGNRLCVVSPTLLLGADDVLLMFSASALVKETHCENISRFNFASVNQLLCFFNSAAQGQRGHGYERMMVKQPIFGSLCKPFQAGRRNIGKVH